ALVAPSTAGGSARLGPLTSTRWLTWPASRGRPRRTTPSATSPAPGPGRPNASPPSGPTWSGDESLGRSSPPAEVSTYVHGSYGTTGELDLRRGSGRRCLRDGEGSRCRQPGIAANRDHTAPAGTFDSAPPGKRNF